MKSSACIIDEQKRISKKFQLEVWTWISDVCSTLGIIEQGTGNRTTVVHSSDAVWKSFNTKQSHFGFVNKQKCHHVIELYLAGN